MHAGESRGTRRTTPPLGLRPPSRSCRRREVLLLADADACKVARGSGRDDGRRNDESGPVEWGVQDGGGCAGFAPQAPHLSRRGRHVHQTALRFITYRTRPRRETHNRETQSVVCVFVCVWCESSCSMGQEDGPARSCWCSRARTLWHLPRLPWRCTRRTVNIVSRPISETNRNREKREIWRERDRESAFMCLRAAVEAEEDEHFDGVRRGGDRSEEQPMWRALLHVRAGHLPHAQQRPPRGGPQPQLRTVRRDLAIEKQGVGT